MSTTIRAQVATRACMAHSWSWGGGGATTLLAFKVPVLEQAITLARGGGGRGGVRGWEKRRSQPKGQHAAIG